MRKINIPPIYEEDIICFIYDGFTVQIKYYYEESIIKLIFNCVYLFDFCDFDYLNDTKWRFGLVEYDESSLLKDMFSRIPREEVSRAFGGELEKIRHYKLAIDDEGIYNIVCKDFKVEKE